MQKTLPILSVGSMAFDSVSTPAGKADQVLGGAVNYFSMAASLFNPVSIIAVVGEDFPKNHLDYLNTRGVDTSGVQIAPGKTFHWTGEYTTNLNEATTLHTALNVFEHFNPKLSPAHQASRVVFLANIDPDIQSKVLDQVTAHELVAMDSMNFWITGKLDALKKIIARVDVLCINEKEALQLSNTNSLSKAAIAIRNMGPSTIIIKRGEYGSAVFTPTSTFLAPAVLIDNVVDPTGAGDSFAGAVVGYLAENHAHRHWIKDQPAKWDALIKRAVIHGTVMASFTIQDFSIDRLRKLTREELNLGKEQFLKLISF